MAAGRARTAPAESSSRPTCHVPGAPEIFVIGDNAAVLQADGMPVPGVAPAAKQMGAYVARLISPPA